MSEGYFFLIKNPHICLIIYLPFKRGLPHLSGLNTTLEPAWLPEKTVFERIADARLSQRQPSCLLFAKKEEKKKKQHKAVLVSSSLKPNQQRKDVSTRALDPLRAHGSTPTGDHTETHLTKFFASLACGSYDETLSSSMRYRWIRPERKRHALL